MRVSTVFPLLQHVILNEAECNRKYACTHFTTKFLWYCTARLLEDKGFIPNARRMPYSAAQ